MHKLSLLLFLIFLVNTYHAQNPAKQSEKTVIDSIRDKASVELDSIYKSNIKKSKLYNVYIPKDLEDAFAELDRLSPKESLERLRKIDEVTMARKLHFGLGKWISHNWNLVEGSRYSQYLKGLGLVFADEMIDFTLVSYHRHLTQKPQEIAERVKTYEKKRNAINK
jgi:hypothetical protein